MLSSDLASSAVPESQSPRESQTPHAAWTPFQIRDLVDGIESHPSILTARLKSSSSPSTSPRPSHLSTNFLLCQPILSAIMTAAVHWSSSALSTFPPSPFPSSYSPPDECSPQQVMHSHHFQLPPPAPPASHNYRSSPASSTTSNTSYQSPASWRSASHTTVPVVLPPARSVPGYGSPNEPRLSPPSQTTTHETFIHSPGAPPDGRYLHTSSPSSSIFSTTDDSRPPYGASSFGTPGPGQAHHSAYPASRPRGSFSDHSTNAGGFPNFPDPGPQSHSRSTPSGKGRQNRNRCHLHIRQHPRATRAGPDGKDRR